MPTYDTAEKLPVVGPWIGKFGKIQDIMATPCEVSPEVWVLAFFSGAPMALFSLFKPDPFDQVSQRAGLGHKKRTRRRFRWDDAIKLDPGKRGSLRWVVFRLGSWAERIGWYMLIADVAFDWAYNWSSMAYQWSGCQNPNASWGYNSCSNVTALGGQKIWAGYSGTNHHGKITTDDFSVIATTQMVASPYIDMQVSPSHIGGTTPDWVELKLIDLSSGWQSSPYIFEPKNPRAPNRWQEVFRNYSGLGGKPRICMQYNSSGGVCTLNGKIGLNGETGRGLTFDP